MVFTKDYPFIAFQFCSEHTHVKFKFPSQCNINHLLSSAKKRKMLFLKFFIIFTFSRYRRDRYIWRKEISDT